MLADKYVAIIDRHWNRLTNDHETEEHGSWATILESTSRSNEETSTNGTTTEDIESVFLRFLTKIITRRPTHMAIICICLPLRLRCSVFSPFARLSRSAPSGEASMYFFSPSAGPVFDSDSIVCRQQVSSVLSSRMFWECKGCERVLGMRSPSLMKRGT
jgi:hypothetical protein